jgi:monoterpene epsilon-lactone hydrolase
MSFQAALASLWIRARIKRKPAGEVALVKFTRRVFATPAWAVRFHSREVEIEERQEPVKGEWIWARDGEQTSRVIYYLHGGGYVSGSPKGYRPITATLARLLKARSFALDYRLAPEFRFPAALEDAVAGYRWLISIGIEPREISIVGDSAGGGLVLALVMKLRDLGDPLPASVVSLSPWTDMAGTGESIQANSKRDPFFVPEDVERYAHLYLGEQSRQTPLASPLYGDFSGLPPLLIQAGASEMLLDDARGVHARAIAAGVSSELQIFKGVPHVWHLMTPFVPEARTALRQVAAFIERYGAGTPPCR